MKILIISDIHANFEALAALKSYIEGVDVVLNLGDITGYSCAVNECIDFLRKYNVISIQGNHDRYVIEGLDIQTKFLNESVRFGINHARKVITDDNLKWLQSLPLTLTLNLDGVTVSMNHGSPYDTINQYVYENNTDFSTWSQFVYDLILIGHTHRELYHPTEHSKIINPGSVGQARDFEGKACAILFDTTSKEFERLHIDYNWKKNLALSETFGGGDYLYKHYQTLLSQHDTF